MNKLLLIIKREYLTRVRKRSFILATLLTPLGIALFFVVSTLIFQYENDEAQRIAIVDEGKVIQGAIKDERNLYFKLVSEDISTVKEQVKEGVYDAILVIPPITDVFSKNYSINYYSDKNPSLDVMAVVSSKLEQKIEAYKIQQMELDTKALNALKTKVELKTSSLNPNDTKSSEVTSIVSAAIGGLMGIIMYMAVFIYGMMVMRSVIEEKTSRIVEVMISSVRPFQLMLGKIIGVGAVGLTQVAIWAILIPILLLLTSLIFGIDTNEIQANQPTMANIPEGMDAEEMEIMAKKVIAAFGDLNWWLIVPLFIFYFLGGYLLYASMFAAVGSAMGDDMGEGQSLTIPITIPVILAFYIMFSAINSPHSSLAVWSSIFPLFSPIVMPARLAFEPPLWEVLLSMVLLIATCIFFVWLSARIYRVGILMYGKKITFKELGKWIFYRD